MSTPLPPYREWHSVKMFSSKAPMWVESEATAVELVPQIVCWRQAKVALAISMAMARAVSRVR